MIAIIDYGVGNIQNVERAIRHLGYKTMLTHQEAEILEADCIVLPGVGHFKAAMTALEACNLVSILKGIQSKPIIGICLGMQLLYEFSEEGYVDGLGLIPGQVKHIQTLLPVPHLGWNELHSDHPNLKGDVYFIHSYQAEMNAYTVAYADYETEIPAVVQHRNAIGIQFHPEKSGEVGLNILETALKGGFVDDRNLASH
ncbi:imidazole glycerol phosphate synthase subunit HisH [Staphylococcus massiliensis CCUG 55927]|uniref:imidazole glycerol phosphate synthase subunit HisH n=1 Tax=Staphylococcus massiliensis TaxID=555791 RepID=UPI0002E7F8FF|nr:imidazole glycerol phosphate synthase subunit HisH [Staphylococcus massiliensis]POA00397.1 imidazole glycerol phosphate synthase subunit HisH [Staphylococcus massiliensis CCUG 55927]